MSDERDRQQHGGCDVQISATLADVTQALGRGRVVLRSSSDGCTDRPENDGRSVTPPSLLDDSGDQFQPRTTVEQLAPGCEKRPLQTTHSLPEPGQLGAFIHHRRPSSHGRDGKTRQAFLHRTAATSLLCATPCRVVNRQVAIVKPVAVLRSPRDATAPVRARGAGRSLRCVAPTGPADHPASGLPRAGGATDRYDDLGRRRGRRMGEAQPSTPANGRRRASLSPASRAGGPLTTRDQSPARCPVNRGLNERPARAGGHPAHRRTPRPIRPAARPGPSRP